jgi:hypothetical protein
MKASALFGALDVRERPESVVLQLEEPVGVIERGGDSDERPSAAR